MAAISALLRPSLPGSGHLSTSIAIKLLPHQRHVALLPLSSSSKSDFDPLFYGPSLQKGLPPPPIPADPSPEIPSMASELDRSSFTRSFSLSALRVPAARCSELESRLRGHLLNWPRIRNVARVPSDDLDPFLAPLLAHPHNQEQEQEEEEEEEEEERGRISSVEYREKLAKEFNWRGFAKFRSLAKLSRPRKKKKREEEEVGSERRREIATVEMVESEGEERDTWRRLIGDDGFPGERWRGPTRLLLLDERYADSGAGELPQAVQVLMRGEPSQFELVRCRLTLTYEYWPANEILASLLPSGLIVPSAFETVGHIAHLNLRDEHLPFKRVIAQVILDKNRPKIETVVNKTEPVQGDFRTMSLEVLAGNHSLVTSVVEGGARFQVNLATVYWNSRLAMERQRLVSGFRSDDIVCDVFAGVGPIAIAAAKKVRRVYANDLNPAAVDYLRTNLSLNKLERKVQVFNMDGRRFIEAVFSLLPTPTGGETTTHFVMNLPGDAVDFLDAFKGRLGRSGGGVTKRLMIHVYGFSKSRDPEYDFRERIALALCCDLSSEVDIHRVRLVAPGKWMLCASFLLSAISFGPTARI
ncbi:met-10+ like family protein [Wolffia australiana]